MRIEDISQWRQFIIECFGDEEIQTSLISYVEKLLAKKSVIIFEVDHLAKLLGIKNVILRRMIHDTEAFYYKFTIPKKSGGEREISAPYPILLMAQNWIYHNLLACQPIHSAATGFIKNKSIKDNADVHLRSKYILKLDLENFFPSIGINRVIAVFLGMGYTPKLSYYLASLCCLNGVLPQGAPTSPALSNIISKRLDYRIDGFALKNGLKYTRYADDIVLSGDKIDAAILNLIQKIVDTEGFTIKEEKTRFYKERGQRIITGLSISGHKVTIPKVQRRAIRQELHYIKKYGLSDHMDRKNIDDVIHGYRLSGYLQFWRSIEPDNEFVLQSIESMRQIMPKLYIDNESPE